MLANKPDDPRHVDTCKLCDAVIVTYDKSKDPSTQVELDWVNPSPAPMIWGKGVKWKCPHCGAWNKQ